MNGRMSRQSWGRWVGIVILGVLTGVGSAWVVRAASAPTLIIETGPEATRREIEAAPEAPAMSFIDSPSATCSRPASGTGACYIQWTYLYVTASASQYIISMTVDIDGHTRAAHSGFFQTSMYIPGSMYGPGFKVTCGFPGASGSPDLGNTFAYTLRARETGGLSAANYGSVSCPADVVKLYLPVVKK